MNYPPNNNCQMSNTCKQKYKSNYLEYTLKVKYILVLVEHPEYKTSDRYPGPVGRKFGRIDPPSMAQEE